MPTNTLNCQPGTHLRRQRCALLHHSSQLVLAGVQLLLHAKQLLRRRQRHGRLARAPVSLLLVGGHGRQAGFQLDNLLLQHGGQTSTASALCPARGSSGCVSGGYRPYTRLLRAAGQVANGHS